MHVAPLYNNVGWNQKPRKLSSGGPVVYHRTHRCHINDRVALHKVSYATWTVAVGSCCVHESSSHRRQLVSQIPHASNSHQQTQGTLVLRRLKHRCNILLVWLPSAPLLESPVTVSIGWWTIPIRPRTAPIGGRFPAYFGASRHNYYPPLFPDPILEFVENLISCISHKKSRAVLRHRIVRLIPSTAYSGHVIVIPKVNTDELISETDHHGQHRRARILRPVRNYSAKMVQ
ncbi:hypothetical protein F5I97DRAFT_968199 [Phlebopus sp. FC_14]|nr:hypothetical protein F5I97DRAFT_968199 [Phlebopus sp. FC_14]